MSSTIRIKRSGTTGSPNTLELAELAYSYLAGTQTNGGDRLYIGTGGVDVNGNALTIDVIGGKYFTDKLNHELGTLTANSAILVDANKKINELLIDNLKLDGNELSSTSINGDILITPDGDGKTIVKNLFVNDGQTSVEDVIINVAQGNLIVEGTTNEVDVTSGFDSGGVLAFTVGLADIFSADTFGSSTEVPVITVDSTGRITAVTTETISTEVSVAGDTGTDDVSLLDDTLNFVSGTNAGISVDVTRATDDVFVTVSLDQDLSTTGSPTFSALTVTNNAAVNGGSLTTTATTANLFNANATTLNVGGAATTVSIGAATGTTTVNNNLDVDGDLDVNGGDITTGQTTFNLVNTTATTVNFAGDATTVSIGAASGETTVNNDLIVTGDAAVNGGNLTTTETTAAIFNDTVTDLSIGNDATTISIGAATGTTTINNDAVIAGDLTVQGTLTSVETTNLQVEDPLVKFGLDNPADAFSIGFYGEYVDNATTLKTGFFRDHVSKEYFLFKDLNANIQDNDISASGITLADLNVANLAIETDVAVGGDITAIGDITGDQINATLFVGEIDGGTY
jgi:hypothetical protein